MIENRKQLAPPLYISVGHTAKSSENTGIQRVTRSFARAAVELFEELELVEWHQELQCYKYLGDDPRRRFADYGGPHSEGPDIESRVPAPPKWIPYLPIPATLRRKMREAFRNRHRARLWRFQPGPGGWVVVPELATAEELNGIITFTQSAGAKVAVIFHDSIAIRHPEWVNDKVNRNHRDYLEATTRADCVLPVSQFAAEGYREFVDENRLPLPPTHVCENAAEFSRYGRKRVYDPPQTDEVFALCVSTLEPRKNHGNLVEAFDWLCVNYPEIPLHLTLVGNPYPGATDIESRIRRDCERNKRLQWLGPVDDHDLESLYRGSHFCVFPSRIEGFGLPILESLWHGLPCVCSNEGAMGEQSIGGGCLTVDVGDFRQIGLALKRMAEDRGLREKLAAECAARELRTWTDYALDLVGRLNGR